MRHFLLALAIGLSSVSSAERNPQTLIGGSEVNLKDYPEVVYYTADRAACSGTVVGPSIVLTAAHCVQNGQHITDWQGKWQASCVRHPTYTDTQDYNAVDMAVCKRLDGSFRMKPATIADVGPVVGDEITLSGYGCVRSDGKGGNDGTLRVGMAPVIGLTEEWYLEYWFYTQGDSALCYGDSGGPAFRLIEDPKEDAHVVLGVNSRGDIKSLSMLTAVYLDISRQFLLDYAKAKRVKICGITHDC